MYEHGLGVIQDHAVAASAERGEPQAQYNLADLYLRAEGVPHDEATAFARFQKATLQGHTLARIMLGSICALGRGTPKDLHPLIFGSPAPLCKATPAAAPRFRRSKLN